MCPRLMLSFHQLSLSCVSPCQLLHVLGSLSLWMVFHIRNAVRAYHLRTYSCQALQNTHRTTSVYKGLDNALNY